MQYKVPRYSRRVQSKSEPSHGSQEVDSEGSEAEEVGLDSVRESWEEEEEVSWFELLSWCH